MHVLVSLAAQLSCQRGDMGVLDALRDIPGDYRVVLDLVHVRGLSLAVAATVMDRSDGAVRMLYGRAVTKLRRELENGESNEHG